VLELAETPALIFDEASKNWMDEPLLHADLERKSAANEKMHWF
jgi:hypothetical protein